MGAIEEAHPGTPMIVADASAVGSAPAQAPGEPPTIKLLVVDSVAAAEVDLVIDRARHADPPIPVVVRAPTELDVDHLRDLDGVELVVDESASAAVFRHAVLHALDPPGGPG